MGGAGGYPRGVAFNEGGLHVIGSANEQAVENGRREMPVNQQFQTVPDFDEQARPGAVLLPEGVKQKTDGHIPGVAGRDVLLPDGINDHLPPVSVPAVQQGLQNFFRTAAGQAVDKKRHLLHFISSSKCSTFRTALS